MFITTMYWAIECDTAALVTWIVAGHPIQDKLHRPSVSPPVATEEEEEDDFVQGKPLNGLNCKLSEFIVEIHCNSCA